MANYEALKKEFLSQRAAFTPEELKQLQKALFDLSGDIKNTALELGVH